MKRILAAVSVALAAMLALAGPVSAETGDQSFIITGQGDEATVFASGPISGVGQDFESQVEESSTFVFDEGNVIVDHPTTDDDFRFNSQTCFGTAEFEGTYSIRSGTGIYADAEGSGNYRGRAIFLAERTSEGCSETESVFDFFYVVATGTTTLS